MQHISKTDRKIKCPVRLTNDTLSLLDWILFAVLAFLCYFTFQQKDILHTGGASMNWLTGHVFDAYDNFGDMFYLPTTYWLFALWNIPLRLFGIVTEATKSVPYSAIMWYKALPTLFYLVTAYLIYDLGMLLGMQDRKSKIAAYVFLTAPIAFYSQFMFGQYDIFTVFFVVLGVRAWLKHQNIRFTLFFGIAVTFKYFSLLIFLPILFLREKNIKKMIGHILLVVVPAALEIAMYYHSPGFRGNILFFAGDKGNYLLLSSLPLGQYTTLYLFLPLYALICGIAYCTDVESDRAAGQWMLYISTLVMFVLFGTSMFHPQWLLFAVPFLTLSTMLHRRSDGFLFLDIVMYGAFMLFTINAWPKHLDHYLFKYGFFGALFDPMRNDGLLMCDLLPGKDTALCYSVLSALLLVNAVFKHPRYLDADPTRFDKSSWWIVRTRLIASVLLFVLPATYCFYNSFRQPAAFFNESGIVSVTDEITEEYELHQFFVAEADNLSRIDIRTATFMRVNTSTLTIKVVDPLTGDTLATVNADCRSMRDNDFTSFTFEPIALTSGKQYRLTITSDAQRGNGVCIYYDNGGKTDLRNYAAMGFEKLPYNYCIRLFAQ